jgi:hypothetical protein
LANWTAPVVPVLVTFQALVTAAPAGRVRPTFQPVIAEAPAVTFTVATKPPFQELTATEALQPTPGCGLPDGLELGTGLLGELALGTGVLGEAPRTGVDQSRQSDSRPSALLEMRIVPGSVPVRSRNFWMCCRSGAAHSGRVAQ